MADPWSAVKIVLPSVAIEYVIHQTTWSKTPLRHMTLYLALLNTYWFASIINSSLIECPLFLCGETSSDGHPISAHRFAVINKLELVAGIVGLDLFNLWHRNVVTQNGFVDNCLKAAVVAPALITVIQALYFVPKLGQTKEKGLPSPPCLHRTHIGLEAVKATGLAVAGLRFGRMLI